MGEVYRARDRRLNRDVAIKILPDSFVHDPDRLARFEREAQVLAALNHPHIAHIYGLEESDHVRGLVMEYVEGSTLADVIENRLQRQPIPIAEALPVARQIADALVYAHDRGIVHRDLKPANVKLTPDGTVKVLDFGLAKALDLPTGVGSLANSPTLTSPATHAGVILGTAAYMSPEQARGRPVDERADVWAFGVVIFELLSGRRLFSGETISETLAEVLKTSPPWASLPADTPAPVRRLLRRALEKDPDRRLRSIADARLEIDEALGVHAEEPAESLPPRTRRSAGLLIGAILGAALLTGLAAWSLRSPSRPEPLVFDIAPPDGMAFGPSANVAPMPAVSPDGRHIAMLLMPASGSGPATIWVRSLSDSRMRLIPGTENAQAPFWSPDGQHLGYFADSRLKRVALAGGPAQTLCEVGPRVEGATWSRDGVIVFAADERKGLFRVSQTGGQPQLLIGPAAGQVAWVARWPSFLPDGRRFVLSQQDGIYLAALDDPRPRRIGDSDSKAIYAAGHLFFVREASLMAARFDPETGQLKGEAFPVAESVRLGQGVSGRAAFSVSDAGTVVYRQGGALLSQLTLLDRGGKVIRRIGEPADHDQLALSPDGTRVVVTIGPRSDHDLWVVDLTRDVRMKITREGGRRWPGVWSPDSRSIVVVVNIGGAFDGPFSVGSYLRLRDGRRGNARRGCPESLARRMAARGKDSGVLGGRAVGRRAPEPCRVRLLRAATRWRPNATTHPGHGTRRHWRAVSGRPLDGVQLARHGPIRSVPATLAGRRRAVGGVHQRWQ
jgi:serine/threonine protein kinase